MSLSNYIFQGAMDKIEESQSKQDISKTTVPDATELSVISGVYLDRYNYEIISAEDDSRYAVSFDPFLPLNDTIMIGAMIETITQVYGKHRLADLEPKLVQRNGIGLIYFEGVDYDYYFSIVKEDTGDINSFTMWTE